MDEAFEAQLTALGNEVKAAVIPDGCKQTAAWCFGQLPKLYVQFRQTNESRYVDAITHLVQGAVNALAACPQAQQLTTNMAARFQLLHEQHGLPALSLKPAKTSRKIRQSHEEKQRATQG